VPTTWQLLIAFFLSSHTLIGPLSSLGLALYSFSVGLLFFLSFLLGDGREVTLVLFFYTEFEHHVFQFLSALLFELYKHLIFNSGLHYYCQSFFLKKFNHIKN
jgi:hypothetical protein